MLELKYQIWPGSEVYFFGICLVPKDWHFFYQLNHKFPIANPRLKDKYICLHLDLHLEQLIQCCNFTKFLIFTMIFSTLKKIMNIPPLEESIRCPKRIANALFFGDSPPPKNKLIEYIVISRKFQYLKKKSRTCLLRQKKNP